VKNFPGRHYFTGHFIGLQVHPSNHWLWLSLIPYVQIIPIFITWNIKTNETSQKVPIHEQNSVSDGDEDDSFESDSNSGESYEDMSGQDSQPVSICCELFHNFPVLFKILVFVFHNYTIDVKISK
jgi:hypothetical protein